MAEAVGRSKAWVKKWLKRIRSCPLEDQQVLQSQSRACKRLPPACPEIVVEQILSQDQSLHQADIALPHSTRTIWKILNQCHRIPHLTAPPHDPEERPEPGVEWGMDFHDVSSVPADPEGKQQHVVEILNIVDHGSSVVVAPEPGSHYTAETALRTVADMLLIQGCPDRIRIDRVKRWVGSWTTKDFPSPLLRFLMCLGIEPKVCPPHEPKKKDYDSYCTSFVLSGRTFG